ncbi:hypothetical protein ILUMI_07100 [Ignelater luminosus]|uniref:Uncharacterized protein n=1 Tax=Ignelater luminosus TaxID=2038154 RepID=A0A8K0D8Q4_IGNLU|nr:hypothetical protein ILUMI_07100 [Ignelater luminosus]
MQFLCCFLVSLLVVGVYSNCGCLKCNPDTLQVASPPGSPVKVIYKTPPCHCPTNHPYSVQIPVAPLSPCNFRCYGYRVKRQRVPSVAPCPIPRDYNVQIQIPVNPKPNNYIVGLVAAPDRIVLPGPPPSACPPPGAPAPIPPISFETLQLADAKPDFFYLPKEPSCGCSRYARHIFMPKKSPDILKTFRKDPYLPATPISGTATYFYWKNQKKSPIIRKTYSRIFHPSQAGITIEDELKYDYRTPLTSHINSLEPNFFGDEYNSKTRFLNVIRHTPMNPRKQILYTPEDFIYPEIYFSHLNFPKELFHHQHSRPTANNIFKVHHRFVKPQISNFSNFYNLNNAFGNHQTIQPSVLKEIHLKKVKLENPIHHTPNEKLKTNLFQRNSAFDSDKTSLLPQNFPIKISIHIPRSHLNKSIFPENQTVESSNNVAADTVEIVNKRNLEFPDQEIDVPQQTAQNKFVDNKSKEVNSTKDPFIKRGFHNIRFSISPNQQKISYLEQLFLTNKDSKHRFVINSKTVELSNLDKYKYETEPEKEISEDIAAARQRRAINMKLLSMKPENPPKFLRKYSLRRNEKVASPYQTKQVNTAKKNKMSSPLKQKKSRLNPNKSKNNIIKANLKKTNTIIKQWLLKLKPLNPPEIQIPKFPESVNKQWWMDEENFEEKPEKKKTLKGFKNLRRLKRAIRQKENDIIPYFTLPEVNKKGINKKDALETKRKSPADSFLMPLNFEHILHPTPMLHLLNAPIRYLNHIHKLRSHVNPVVSAFPKVMQASKKYLLGLVKECGKNFFKLGTSFVKDISSLKKLKLLPKLRHKRSNQKEKLVPEEVNMETKISKKNKWNEDYFNKKHKMFQYQNQLNIKEEGGKSNHSYNRHEDIVNDIMLILSDILHNHKLLKQNQYDVVNHNNYNNLQEIEKHVNIEDITQSFLSGLAIAQKTSRGLETKDSLLPQRSKREIFRNGNYYSKLFRKSSPIKLQKYKRETKAENEMDKFLGSSKDDKEVKRFMRYLESPKDFLIQTEASVNKSQSSTQERKKRSASQNSDTKLKVLPSQVLNEEKQKTLNLSELDIQRQIIKENIGKILKRIRTIKNYEALEDLETYKGLSKLQKLKLNIVIQLILRRVENFIVMKKEAETLKNTVFEQIIDKLYNQRYISSNDWIRKLILLQKFHCIIRNINPEQQNNLQIDFLKTLSFIPEKNEEEILNSIRATKTREIKRLNDAAQHLKLALNSGNEENIRKVAKVSWAISNVEKLQKDSIVELHKKIIEGLQIRKELKILFDLQRQLEMFEDKETPLIEDLEK